MESVGQMFGFLVYVTQYASKADGNILFIPKVHDRAQVFRSCPSGGNGGRPIYVGAIERWSNQKLALPNAKCASNISLFLLVENMGRINYGQYMFDRKGILSSVYLDGRILNGWKMISLPLHNLNEVQNISPVIRAANSRFLSASVHTKLKDQHGMKQFISKISLHFAEHVSKEPAFYTGDFSVEKEDQIKDTFLSFSGWGKGIAFVNDFNIGRYWPVKIFIWTTMQSLCSFSNPSPGGK